MVSSSVQRILARVISSLPSKNEVSYCSRSSDYSDGHIENCVRDAVRGQESSICKDMELEGGMA